MFFNGGNVGVRRSTVSYCWSSLVAQRVKDLALSPLWPWSHLWCMFDPWPRNCRRCGKKKKKKKKLLLKYTLLPMKYCGENLEPRSSRRGAVVNESD